MSNEEVLAEKKAEKASELEGEAEGSAISEPESQDFGEAAITTIGIPVLPETSEERVWEDSREYGEGGKFYLFIEGEGAEYPSVLGEIEGSVTSVSSIAGSEVEETEEEKELKRERELLLEEIRQKILDRLLLRRRNAFLHKKLVEHFKKRRMDNVLKEEPKGLDLESKYLKRLYAYKEFKQAQETEIQELNRSMEQFRVETEELKNELEATLTNFMTKAKEISLNLISSKTGKKLNEKAVDRLLRRHRQKNEEKGRKKLRYIKVKNLIEEKERQLKAMEYFGEGLHIVDYEQMKIDNQNYTDKIEEKEEELSKMRFKTQGIIQNLAHIREKAYAIEGDTELMEEKVYDVEKKFIEVRERLTKARKKRDFLREEYGKLKSISGLLTRDELLRDFEASIYEAKNLVRNLDKMKKMISEKKKQENELAKIVVNTNLENTLPIEIRLSSKSKSRLLNFRDAI